MPTETQIKKVEKSLRDYRKRYLKKEFSKLDESATGIMTNAFLTDVLGYKELEEIKTEYQIRGEYADYVVQLKRKKQFVVEVKSVQLDLNEKHLRQSTAYAANEGIDWIILLNGRQLQLYRVLFEKPIRTTQVLNIDLADIKALKSAAASIVMLTKQMVQRDELENLWLRQIALSPDNLAKLLYSEEVAKYLRRSIKQETGIYFTLEETSKALHDAIASVVAEKLKLRLRKKKND